MLTLAAVGAAVAVLHGAGLYGLDNAATPARGEAKPRVVRVALLSVATLVSSVPVAAPLQADDPALGPAPASEPISLPLPVVAGAQAPADAGAAFFDVPAVLADPASFIRLAELSRPPEWLALDAAPAAPEPADLASGLLVTLYLDEAGHVAAMQVDDEARLSDAQTWLAQVLSRGRFRPAEIDGNPVRSRLEARLLPLTTGVQVWPIDRSSSR